MLNQILDILKSETRIINIIVVNQELNQIKP